MGVTHSCHIYIQGMTCIQCEKKIQRLLKSSDGISDIKVSYRDSDAFFVYDSTKITYDDIVGLIRDIGYEVSRKPPKSFVGNTLISIGAIALLFAVLEHFGLLNMLVPSQLADSGMGYGTLFTVGLFTSFHCIAMCGGIGLSQNLPDSDKRRTSYRNAVFYNTGRVISYTLAGLILGTIGYFAGGGSSFGIPLIIQGALKIAAGLILLVMGLQMLGIFPDMQKLGFRLPKFLVNSAGKAAARSKTPLIVGLLNGLMPCGPLQAMWLVALASGSPLKGSMSMFWFSLGTVPLMLGLGTFITVLGRRFTKAVRNIGAVIAAVMGLSMLSQGSTLSGMISDSLLYAVLTGAALLAICSSLPLKNKTVRYGLSVVVGVIAVFGTMFIQNVSVSKVSENTAYIADGIQFVSSTLKSGSYPEITVQSGIPVQWTVTAGEGSINGCNNRFTSSAFSLDYTFHEGDNLIEFTPENTGDYTYTCWMGMIKGTIHVTDNND